MDYRLVDMTERYMKRRGLRNKYDNVVLAGAALGAITDKYPDWNKTFWEELELSIDLHHIQKVILLDHRDCGAYKQLLGEDFAREPKKEREVHAAQLKRLRELINERYAQLEVETLLMSLTGAVEKI
jgi:carbonic anhydrase